MRWLMSDLLMEDDRVRFGAWMTRGQRDALVDRIEGTGRGRADWLLFNNYKTESYLGLPGLQVGLTNR